MRFGGVVGASGKIVAIAPSITINATTNFNQNLATFNATVNPNGAITSVKFQYKRNIDSTWIDGDTVGASGGSQTVYSNQSGLMYAGTLYDVRAIATNSAGTTTSGVTQFTTWSLKSVGYASSTSITIPTVTPTASMTVVPSVYNVFMVGGGGGANGGGGGGGGTAFISSRQFNNASNLLLTITVGAGGAYGANNGGASSLSGLSFTTISAAGGSGAPGDVNGGSSGNGYAGGSGINVNDGSAKSPVYCAGYGGGGGANGYGGTGYSSNGTYSGYAYGGNGGSPLYNATWNVYVGGGGGGEAYATNGGSYGASGGGSYGVGGTANAGSSGAVWFQYYGP